MTDNCPINPLYDNIVVELKENEYRRTEQGLMVAPDRDHFGQVTAAGHGRLINGEIVPLKVKKGDWVIFGGRGTITELDGRIYLIFKENNLVGVLDPEYMEKREEENSEKRIITF